MRDGWSLPQLARAGRLPAWAIAVPEVSWSEGTLIDAFFELSSCRAFTDHCMGPIPWTAIATYADRLNLPRAIVLAFTRAVQVLDDAYCDWHARQPKRKPEGTVESGKVTERDSIVTGGPRRRG
jgi:hypothetical protein